MQNRTPKYPGRVKLVPVDAANGIYDMIRADEPTQPGDPLNKNTFLKDETAALFGLDGTAVPDDVFKWLGEWGRSNWKLLAEYNEAGAYTFTVPDDVDELGVFVLGGGSGGDVALGYSSKAFSANGGSSGGLVQRVLRRANNDFSSGDIVAVVVGKGGAGAKSITGTYTKPGSGQESSFGVVSSGTLGQPCDADISGYEQDVSAPYGFDAIMASKNAVPLRGPAYVFSYRGRNVFDPGDLHIYCGAGGSACNLSSSSSKAYWAQPTVSRILGAAGAGKCYNGAVDPAYGINATAPGDGGGALVYITAYEDRAPATGGNGADGLVMVYGRKEVSA